MLSSASTWIALVLVCCHGGSVLATGPKTHTAATCAATTKLTTAPAGAICALTGTVANPYATTFNATTHECAANCFASNECQSFVVNSISCGLYNKAVNKKNVITGSAFSSSTLYDLDCFSCRRAPVGKCQFETSATNGDWSTGQLSPWKLIGTPKSFWAIEQRKDTTSPNYNLRVSSVDGTFAKQRLAQLFHACQGAPVMVTFSILMSQADPNSTVVVSYSNQNVTVDPTPVGSWYSFQTNFVTQQDQPSLEIIFSTYGDTNYYIDDIVAYVQTS